MRLFVALDIDDRIRACIARFVEKVREFTPDARWVRPESLHVTLKFIGEKSEDEMENIKRGLQSISAGTIGMNICGLGFFPGPRMPRVFWVGIQAGAALTSLAASIDDKLSPLGISKEEHAFSPHLTLARGGAGSGFPRKLKSDSPNRGFQRLQEQLAVLPTPEFGTMTAREFFLYQSQLSSGGSKYTKLSGFGLQ